MFVILLKGGILRKTAVLLDFVQIENALTKKQFFLKDTFPEL